VLNTKKSRKAWIICKNLLILKNHQILENLRKKQIVNKEAGPLIENLIKKINIKKKEVRKK
jgi:ABC-type dipeptide/oligopeptide/nickel transport system ATPase subunit